MRARILREIGGRDRDTPHIDQLGDQLTAAHMCMHMDMHMYMCLEAKVKVRVRQ